MNVTMLTGRIAKDIVLKKTLNGTSVVGFTLAVYRQKEGADFIPCVAYNQTAELIDKYLIKGSHIAITGRINTRNYDNVVGQKVYVTEVIVDRVEFLDKKDSRGDKSITEIGKSYSINSIDNNDSLPF